jgi:hypothetical protein
VTKNVRGGQLRKVQEIVWLVTNFILCLGGFPCCDRLVWIDIHLRDIIQMMLRSSEGLVGLKDHQRKGSPGKKRMLIEQDPVAFACLLPLCSICFSCK